MSMAVRDAIKYIDRLLIAPPGLIPGIDKQTDMLEQARSALVEKAEREDPKPLTLKELRRMIGEPVYIVGCGGGHWEIFGGYNDVSFWCRDETFYLVKSYGKTWHACRHKPKEVTHE